MALWICTDCTCRYSVGAARCPQCSSSEYVEEGQEPMPKITVHGGPSIAGASVVGGSWSSEGDADVWPEPASEEPETGAELAASGSETSPAPDYETWTVEQLKEQLTARGLSKSGKRDDLIARLTEDDDAAVNETRAHAEPATGSGEAADLR